MVGTEELSSFVKALTFELVIQDLILGLVVQSIVGLPLNEPVKRST